MEHLRQASGVSVRANRGRVMVAVVQGENWQQKTPKHSLEEARRRSLNGCARFIEPGQRSRDPRGRLRQNGQVQRQGRGAVHRQLVEIKEAYRNPPMDPGNKIQPQDMAVELREVRYRRSDRGPEGQATGRWSDVAAPTARRRADHHQPRAVCVSTPRVSTESARKDTRIQSAGVMAD